MNQAAPQLQAPPARPPGVHQKAVWNAGQALWRDGVYWFDERVADNAARFFPTYLTFTIGEWSGQNGRKFWPEFFLDCPRDCQGLVKAN